MLERLFIQNVGLIESCEVDFSQGLTVITGETGAGKSMLIDALSLALGDRSSSSVIRHGESKASIEAAFISTSTAVSELLLGAGIEVEDGSIVLRRLITKDKSRAFINGTQVTQSLLKQVGELLVDIHGQHDHQMILRAANHTKMLDTFGRLESETKTVRGSYSAWRAAEDALLDALATIDNREQEEILLKSYIEELDRFSPQQGEEEDLSAQRKALMNAEKLISAVSQAHACLSDESDILSRVRMAESALSSVSDVSADVAGLLTRLEAVSCELVETSSDIERYLGRLEVDPQRLQEVDERLFALKDLARKHNCSADELPETLASLQARLDGLSSLQGNVDMLRAQSEKARDSFQSACARLTKARHKVAKNLGDAVAEALVSLEMPNTSFVAQLAAREEQEWTSSGAESVEFMVSTNAGVPLAPLVKVASGGEASRLMLALKQVFYAKSDPMTLVFDEVDTGVSGLVADAMGQALAELAGEHQVFSITHLPQVAAKGAQHVRIAKSTSGDVTRSSLTVLDDAARKEELARMLSGRDITAEALAAAEKLLS